MEIILLEKIINLGELGDANTWEMRFAKLTFMELTNDSTLRFIIISWFSNCSLLASSSRRASWIRASALWVPACSMFVKSAIPAAAECSDDPGADDDVADDDVDDEGVGGVEDVLLASIAERSSWTFARWI